MAPCGPDFEPTGGMTVPPIAIGLQRTGGALAASTDVPSLRLTPTGVLLDANAAAAALFGCTREVLTGRLLAELIHAESSRDMRAQLVLAIETRTVFAGELLFEHASGEAWRCRLTVVPVPGESGQSVELLALLELRSSSLFGPQEEIAEEWSALALLDRMPAGVVVHAPDTRIVYANARAAEVLGVTYDQLVGIPSADPTWEFIDADGQPLAIEQFPVVRALTSGAPVQQLLIGSRRPSDGRLRWGLCDAFPLRDADGKLTAVVVTFVDVTEWRQSEDARREADERLRLVLGATNDALWDMNLVTQEGFSSARFWEMLGYAYGERTTDNATWIALMHPDDREAALADINAAVARGDNTFEREFRLCHKDGHDVLVLCRGRVLRDAQGSAVRIAGTNTDITARRAFEERLRQSQKLESIGQLAGGVAHDFNNLLAIIRGNLELMEAPDLAHAEVVELSREAQSAARRGADLTRQLLAFARQQPLQLTSVDVGEILERYSKVIARLIPESIRIETDLPPTLPSIRADAGLFETALLNLAINARDALPTGGSIRLSARERVAEADDAMRAAGVPRRQVVVEVQDTGVGMSQEVIDRAIEPFFTTKASGHGSGLGLSMVYGFVRQCGGTLEVDSAIGRGTTIRLIFPADTQRSTKAGVPPASVVTTSPRDWVVLVVEDDPAVRRLCVRELQAMGCRALEAANGPEALEQHRLAHRVDLLLTDVIMPGGMNGAQVAAALIERQPELPVVYMSGYHADVLSEYLRTEDAHLLAKPFTIGELRAMIASLPSSAA